MYRLPFLVRLLCGAALSAPTSVLAIDCNGAPPQGALHALLARDRTLASVAERSSAAEAFLQVLAPDSEMFMPHLGSARWFWQRPRAAQRRPGWAPSRVGSSADGLLGYTLGPYWNTRDPARQLRGRYLAIWLSEASSGWQLLLDHGAPAPDLSPPTAAIDDCHPAPPAAGSAEASVRLGRFEALRQAESHLAEAPLAPAALSWQAAGTSARCALPVQRMRIAGSADLAYTAGAAGLRSFVRIWRFAPAQARWAIEVELCGNAAADDQ